MKQEENTAFTGLRGLAAFYVIIYHYHVYDFFHGRVRTILHHGYMAVDLFFILSGFVMAMTYAHYFEEGFNLRRYKHFMGRRFGRIYPLYIVVTIFALATAIITQSLKGGIGTVFANIFLIQSWGLTDSIIGPGWSISTEWAVYILFPILTALLLRTSRWQAIIGGIIAFCGVVMIVMAPSLTHTQPGFYGPLDVHAIDAGPVIRCFCEFALGMLCFRFNDTLRFFQSSAISSIVCAAILVLMAFPNSDLILLIFLTMLIVSLAKNNNSPAKFLSFRPIHGLGVLSYSIYLLHIPLRDAVGEPIKHALIHYHVPGVDKLTVLPLVMIVLAVGYISYRFIEKPARSWVRNILEDRPALSEPNPNLSAP